MKIVKNNSGFTLIELLVVVAIISLLSSVVLASLNSARAKAKDAALKTSIRQAVNLMAMNYSDYGLYSQLWTKTPQQVYNNADCDNTGFTGTYASQMNAICHNIISNLPTGAWFGSVTNVLGTFSLMIYSLNNGNLYCVGSSGTITETSNHNYVGGTPPPPLPIPGCAYNP